MELVAALFTATTAAAPAAVTAAAGASSAMSILQGVTTAGSALFSLASGSSQARQEDLAAKAEALRIKREELIKIGQLRVAFAGSGVDIGSGQTAALEEGIRSQASFETRLVETSGEMRANAARMKGISTAFGQGAGGLLDIARRG
jgi:hypothetical protein